MSGELVCPRRLGVYRIWLRYNESVLLENKLLPTFIEQLELPHFLFELILYVLGLYLDACVLVNRENRVSITKITLFDFHLYLVNFQG